MLAAHSSSALVANIFNYWRLYNNLGPVISAVCPTLRDVTIQEMSFEAQFPITWPAPPPIPVTSPHLDVVIRFQERAEPDIIKAIAIESKFGELYTQDQGTFAERYLAPENAPMWVGVEPLQQVASQIHQGEILFQRLKVAQLIKHILGLKSVLHGNQNFELVYLWYPAPGVHAVVHEDEIRRFQQITNACHPKIKFRAISYHDLIDRLATDQGEQHGAYVDYLMERYF
jgi:hypothetical protein